MARPAQVHVHTGHGPRVELVPFLVGPFVAVVMAIRAVGVNAIRSVGLMVQVEPETFLEVLGRTKDPLVLHSVSGILGKHRYAVAHRGYVVWTKAKEPLAVAADIIEVRRLEMPSV